MGAWSIALVTLYLVFVTVVVFHSLVVLWPPYSKSPDADRGQQQEQAKEETKQGDNGTTGPTTSEPTPDQTTDLSTTDVAVEPAPTGTAAEPMGTEMTPEPGKKSPAQAEGGQVPCACENEQRPVKLFWLFCVCLSDEERLFLIVMFAGALGGLVHTLRSFYWYAGHRKLVLSWAGFYITLPILGAAMATVFYLVIRGGFFSPTSSIGDTSPFGFAALAALIGMFTEQAAMKLKEISGTILAPAEEGSDRAEPAPSAPTLTSVSPTEGPQAGGTPVAITGTGFAQGATVTFGGQAATNIEVAADGASLTADTPAATAPGAVDVEVTTGGKKATLPNGFTYT